MRSGGGIRALLQAGGGRSLYAGVWGNLAGVAPASAIFMAVYEPVKQVGRWQGRAPPAVALPCLLRDQGALPSAWACMHDLQALRRVRQARGAGVTRAHMLPRPPRSL